MAAYTLNALAVLSGQIKLEVRGNWVADLELDGAVAPAEGSAATLAGGGGTLVGTIRQSGSFSGRVRAKVVGGAGKLAAAIPQRHYTSEVAALDVVRDVLTDAGEVLAGDVTLEAHLPRWIRVEDSAAAGLDAIADETGATWRVQPDGTIWIGEDTWPATTEPSLRALSDDKRSKVMLATTTGLTLLPGRTILGQRATTVVYLISGGPRAEIHYGSTRRADMANAIARLGPRPLYRVPYPASIVANQPDGSVDILCDDPKMGALTAVPLAGILPGCKVVPATGSRCRLFFDNGAPQRYFVSIFDGDPTASKGVGRVGDRVHGGWIKVTSTAAGTPALIEYLEPSTPPELRTGFTALDLAEIAAGSDKVFL